MNPNVVSAILAKMDTMSMVVNLNVGTKENNATMETIGNTIPLMCKCNEISGERFFVGTPHQTLECK